MKQRFRNYLQFKPTSPDWFIRQLIKEYPNIMNDLDDHFGDKDEEDIPSDESQLFNIYLELQEYITDKEDDEE